MNRIEAKFRQLRKEGKKAFIAFITAGYPDLGTTKKLIREFDRTGVDIVELGVPFSDPLADGLIIQEASHAALKRNVHLSDILRMVKGIRKSVAIPICLMTYYNPVFSFNEERFIKQAKHSGVDGVIIPDLPPEEAGSLMGLADKNGVDIICFVSPTTSADRIKYIADTSKGFIYYVSLTGVTGPRQNLPAALTGNLKKIKRYTKKPVCVGFGVSSQRQVRQICKSADGVIVGSAIIKIIKENIGKKGLVKKVSVFISAIRQKACTKNGYSKTD